MSLPLPASITSFPAKPLIVSLPPRPQITLAAAVPFRTSLPDVPTIVQIAPLEARTGVGADHALAENPTTTNAAKPEIKRTDLRAIRTPNTTD